MADYLSRHPSPSNKNNQIKAEELWNDLFTVYKIDFEKYVLDEQKRREAENRPIRAKTASESEMPNKNEMVIESERGKQRKRP